MDNMQICTLCGEKHAVKDMELLCVSSGLFGRDLGYICKDCLEHIDNLEYFVRIDGENENG